MSYGANLSHKFLNIPNQTMFVYNAWDVENTAQLARALRREMEGPRFGSQFKYYSDWVQPLIPAMLAMQKRGIPVDVEARRQFDYRCARELFSATERVRDYATETGFGFTDKFPNSDKQLRAFLFDHLELKPAGKTAKGKGKDFSVDLKNLVSVIKKLRKKDEPHREMLYSLTHRSRLNTVYQRYIKFPVRDGRVFPTVKMTGTKTFRYAYKDPALQQFPPETRVYLGGRSGGPRIIAIDYSQLEARILAILAGDTESLECFRKGEDVHTLNARDLFDLTAERWMSMDSSEKTPIRNHAKSFLYRISYGGEGAPESGKEYCPCPKCESLVPPTLNLSRGDNLAAEKRWFDKHSAVRRFHDGLLRTVGELGYYESPVCGVRRYITQPPDQGHGRREVLNIPMQLTGALLVNRAQVNLHRAGAPIILQWHDAFYFECPAGESDRVVEQRAADYKGIMESHVPELGASFPCDVEIGFNLGKRSAENPDGLGQF